MTEEAPLVALEGVSICYRLAKQKIGSLKEYAIHWMKGVLAYEQLWALQDVSLTLRRGETMGIVGQNGAGKSTLLKVISGVLRPTRGRAVVRGRVAPLLALGTGFDYELTGRENIYLNALLLGRKRWEIDERYDEIVEFSGIQDFIHSPIRNYSSGMLARLGFSIITSWTPDILVLDEVLAVGDSQFVGRCTRRIDQLRQQGSAVLLVSHDLEAVRNNCEQAVWLENGCIRAQGMTNEVSHDYVTWIQEHPFD